MRILSCGWSAVMLISNVSHLMGFFYRTIRMVENGIKPAYVFDGKPPELKSGVVRTYTILPVGNSPQSTHSSPSALRRERRRRKRAKRRRKLVSVFSLVHFAPTHEPLRPQVPPRTSTASLGAQ